ncbi:MAG: MarR family winged helix-turn-helix transcriptional regulator [Spirochaetia bacterium]
MSEGAADRAGFGLWISVLNRAATIYFSKALKPYGLGPSQQAYLLSISPGEKIRQDELARRLRVDKANAARAVAKLLKLGYLERECCFEDRREKLVSLTPAGRAVRDSAAEISSGWIEELKSSVTSKEWGVLIRGIEKMARKGMNFAEDYEPDFDSIIE